MDYFFINVKYKLNYSSVIYLNFSPEESFSQENGGTAKELFIFASALLLNLFIRITMERSIREKQYAMRYSNMGGGGGGWTIMIFILRILLVAMHPAVLSRRTVRPRLKRNS